MVAAEALEPLTQRTGAEVGAAGDDDAGRLPSRVGVDDPDRSGGHGFGDGHGVSIG